MSVNIVSSARRNIIACYVYIFACVAHLVKLYELCPEKFTPLLPRFTEFLKGPAGMGEKMTTVQVFSAMAKKEPDVSVLLKSLKKCSVSASSSLLLQQ